MKRSLSKDRDGTFPNASTIGLYSLETNYVLPWYPRKKVLYEFKLFNHAFPNFSKYFQLYIQYHQTLTNWKADLMSANLGLAFSCNLCLEIKKLLKAGLV